MLVTTFFLVAVAAALLADTASAQFKRIDSIGFGKTAEPRTNTAPGGLKGTGSSNKTRQFTAFAPLTKQECEGLGGKVHFTLKCGRFGGGACVTVDSHGVVRSECINK